MIYPHCTLIGSGSCQTSKVPTRGRSTLMSSASRVPSRAGAPFALVRACPLIVSQFNLVQIPRRVWPFSLFPISSPTTTLPSAFFPIIPYNTPIPRNFPHSRTGRARTPHFAPRKLAPVCLSARIRWGAPSHNRPPFSYLLSPASRQWRTPGRARPSRLRGR